MLADAHHDQLDVTRGEQHHDELGTGADGEAGGLHGGALPADPAPEDLQDGAEEVVRP